MSDDGARRPDERGDGPDESVRAETGVAVDRCDGQWGRCSWSCRNARNQRPSRRIGGNTQLPPLTPTVGPCPGRASSSSGRATSTAAAPSPTRSPRASRRPTRPAAPTTSPRSPTPPPSSASATRGTVAGRVHELCVDALARLGESDPVRTARVRAQLVATSDPFGPPEPLDLPPESDDPEAAFLRLQAWHAARFAIEHLPERLAVADQAVELGRRTGTDEYAAWGRRWRMDAYAVLGDRIDLIAEANALRPLVARLARPDWTAYLLLVDASQRLLEGGTTTRWRSSTARSDGGPRGRGRLLPPRLHLGRRDADRPCAAGADRGGAGGGRRPAVPGRWLALRDVQGRPAGARRPRLLWRAHRPARAPLPRPRAGVGDRGRRATRRSAPGSATPRRLASSTTSSRRTPGCTRSAWPRTPYDGPVDLALGRLAATYGDAELARSHLTAALRATEAMHATPVPGPGPRRAR